MMRYLATVGLSLCLAGITQAQCMHGYARPSGGVIYSTPIRSGYVQTIRYSSPIVVTGTTSYASPISGVIVSPGTPSGTVILNAQPSQPLESGTTTAGTVTYTNPTPTYTQPITGSSGTVYTPGTTTTYNPPVVGSPVIGSNLGNPGSFGTVDFSGMGRGPYTPGGSGTSGSGATAIKVLPNGTRISVPVGPSRFGGMNVRPGGRIR